MKLTTRWTGRSGQTRLRGVVRLALCAAALMNGIPGTAAALAVDDPRPALQTPDGHRPTGLDSVLERRFLRVVCAREETNAATAEANGTDRPIELIRAFTAYLNSKYEPGEYELPIAFIVDAVAPDELIPHLLDGRADLIATRTTAAPAATDDAASTITFRVVGEVLLRHEKAPAIRSVGDLSGRTVAVRPGSSDYDDLIRTSARLERMDRPGVRIIEVDADLETEDIVALVAAGHFQYTVADSSVAEAAAAASPMLRIVRDVSLREDGEFAWATLSSAPRLAADMSDFLDRYRHGSPPADAGVRRHLRRGTAVHASSARESTARLSRYDEHFKRFADRYGFDWRLLAAIAYQESRFRQSVTNRWGATGLFQVKPITAREPYIGIRDISGRSNASNNVNAGARYLSWIKERYFDPVEAMHERDRIRMALAAYNAGPRTLLRAQRLAGQMGLDPTRWFRNVELAMLAMDKQEPVKYVSEINQRYLSYVMLGVD